MKVYSWKTLLVTILGGVYFIWKVGDVKTEETSSFVFLIFLGYAILKGLWVSFTKEGFEKDNARERRMKKAYREIFGPWAIIAPWGHVILFFLSMISIKVLPSQRWLAILLIIGSLVYGFVCIGLVRSHMKLEEEIVEKKGEEL